MFLSERAGLDTAIRGIPRVNAGIFGVGQDQGCRRLPIPPAVCVLHGCHRGGVGDQPGYVGQVLAGQRRAQHAVWVVDGGLGDGWRQGRATEVGCGAEVAAQRVGRQSLQASCY